MSTKKVVNSDHMLVPVPVRIYSLGHFNNLFQTLVHISKNDFVQELAVSGVEPWSKLCSTLLLVTNQ